MNLKYYKEKFDTIRSNYEKEEIDINQLEEQIYNLEDSIEGLEENTHTKSLLKSIIVFKKENDFYDAESELDRMFPDRNEEGFDEDSMSYDSVFGSD
jgi:predicted  nucleic acid-binding Zn-ribbon protein